MKNHRITLFVTLLLAFAVWSSQSALTPEDILGAFLTPEDPVYILIQKQKEGDTIDASTTSLIAAVKSGDWNHSAFFKEETYNHILQAYLSSHISQNEFLDAHDYLHLLSDFSLMRPDDNLLVKIPAVHIHRDKLTDTLASELAFHESELKDLTTFRLPTPGDLSVGHPN